MTKKLFVILLLAGVVLAGLFAGFRVGVEGGYGFDFFKLDQSVNFFFFQVNIQGVVINKGVTGNLMLEYDINDNWGIKATGGVMFAGQAECDLEVGGIPGAGGIGTPTTPQEIKEKSADKSGLYYNASLGLKYMLNIGERFSISTLAGCELLYGYPYYQESMSAETKEKSKNLAVGVDAGLELSYLKAGGLRINVGATGAFFFYNTAEAVTAYVNGTATELLLGDKKSTSYFVRPYAGLSYAF